MEECNALRAAKKVLRREILGRLRSLDPQTRQTETVAVLDRCRSVLSVNSAEIVLVYIGALPGELPTRELVGCLLERGITVVCPRVDRKANVLRLHLVQDLDQDLVPGTFKIPEPSASLPELDPQAIDRAIVPGLAFDDQGNRLGRGGGYYDRLLPQLRPEVPRWALAMRPQWVPQIPAEPHDQQLDSVVLPDRIWTKPRTVL